MFKKIEKKLNKIDKNIEQNQKIIYRMNQVDTLQWEKDVIFKINCNSCVRRQG